MNVWFIELFIHNNLICFFFCYRFELHVEYCRFQFGFYLCLYWSFRCEFNHAFGIHWFNVCVIQLIFIFNLLHIVSSQTEPLFVIISLINRMLEFTQFWNIIHLRLCLMIYFPQMSCFLNTLKVLRFVSSLFLVLIQMSGKL